MRLHLHQLNNVYSFLAADKIDDAVKEFVQAIKDFSGKNLRTGESLTIDFASLEVLFKIDKILSKVDRSVFWQKVKSLTKELIPTLPEDVQLYIDKGMKFLPHANDLYRTSQLQVLSEQYTSLPGLQYLLARALEIEGGETNNPLKIRQSLAIFAQLAPLAKGGWMLDGDGSQSLTFAQSRINALIRYLRLLEPKQALDILDDELNTGWSSEAGYLHDHLITRREALADAVNLKEKIDKTFEESTKEYQIKHIEILLIFFGLFSLVMGVLQIVPVQKSLFNALSLMFGFSLSLIAAMGIILGLLTSSKSQRCWRFTLGIMSLLALGTEIVTVNQVEKQATLATEIDKNDNSMQEPPSKNK